MAFGICEETKRHTLSIVALELSSIAGNLGSLRQGVRKGHGTFPQSQGCPSLRPPVASRSSQLAFLSKVGVVLDIWTGSADSRYFGRETAAPFKDGGLLEIFGGL